MAGPGPERRRWRGRPAPRAVPPPAPARSAGAVDPARLAAVHDSGLLDAGRSEPFDRIARLAARLLDAPVALLSVLGADEQVVLGATGAGAWAADGPAGLTHPFCRRVVDRAAPLLLGDAREHARLSTSAAVTSRGLVAYAGVPVHDRDGHALGALCALDLRARDWDEDELGALADLAAAAGAEVARRDLARRLVEEGRTDPLTGLRSRRAWDEEAPRAVARARRFEQPLVLALLDLGRLGRFAARGEGRGDDELLRDAATAWQPLLREVDVLVRLGGDELALLLPGTGLDHAFDVVERLRRALPGSVTCPAGLAVLRQNESAPDLLRRADAALSSARRSGRNASALAS